MSFRQSTIVVAAKQVRIKYYNRDGMPSYKSQRRDGIPSKPRPAFLVIDVSHLLSCLSLVLYGEMIVFHYWLT